ncbi:MAG: archaellin/type IV pilin N-terminal domain-containing protein [Dehalococcoidia bacterium]
MFKPSRAMRRLHRNEEGITGLETAIILIAFVIVASVFAFVVLSTGLFSADRGKQTVLAGLEKASGNIEVRGSVSLQDVGESAAPTVPDGIIGEATGNVDVFIFNLGTAAGGRPVLIDPAATNNTMVVNIVDTGARVANLTYTVNKILGDTDDLLEAGELFEITVTLPDAMILDVNEEFTLELIPQSGGTLLINRIMPPEISDLMDLK